MLESLGFQNKTNIEIIGLWLSHFWFALDSSDIDLLDTDLDFLDTDISSKHFVCLQNFLNTSSAWQFCVVSRTSSEISLRRLQDVLESLEFQNKTNIEIIGLGLGLGLGEPLGLQFY